MRKRVSLEGEKKNSINIMREDDKKLTMHNFQLQESEKKSSNSEMLFLNPEQHFLVMIMMINTKLITTISFSPFNGLIELS